MKTQMKNVIFFIMICCSLSLKISTDLKQTKLPNTDFLFKGYNIFMADLTPKDGDLDPGFKAPIFKGDFTEKLITSDRRFETPDGFHLTKVEGCSVGITSTLITGENSYQNTFGVELGVSGTVKGVKFGASISFQNISSETTKNSKAFIYSKADCRVYQAEMDIDAPPKFHSSFLTALKNISTRNKTFSQDPDFYWRFINNYGTHHIYSVKMGARFGAMSKISQKEVEKQNINTVTLDRSIGFKELFEVKNKITNENKQTSNSLSKMEEVKLFSIGSRPDPNLDAKAWSQKAIDEPMPISYNVRPLIDVFSGNNIYFDLKQFKDKDINIDFVKNNLKEAIDNYCEKYLLANKMVRSCQEVGKDLVLNNVKYDKISHTKEYYLENMETGKCLTVPNNEYEVIMSLPCGTGKIKSQGIYMDYTNDGFYSFYSSVDDDGKCVHADWNNCDENGKFIKFRCEQNGRKYRVVENSDGSYLLQTHCGKCLHVRDDNKADYSQIVASTCNGMPGQNWRAIQVVNKDAFNRNDYLGSIGKMTRCELFTYTIQPGDMLWAIANRYGDSVDGIASRNNIKNANLISANQKIQVCRLQ